MRSLKAGLSSGASRGEGDLSGSNAREMETLQSKTQNADFILGKFSCSQRKFRVGGVPVVKCGDPLSEKTMPAPISTTASATRPDWVAGDAYSMDDILRRDALDIHFQPIVSLKTKTILGVEALARPVDGRSGRPIPPLAWFAWAERWGKTLEVDRLCRRHALKSFVPLAEKSAAPLLFLNFECSVLDQGVLGSGVLSQTVKEAGLEPRNVVIEINESRVIDVAALQRFVEARRAEGFLIALDDIGAGFSNLPRIALLKPEILKLDRALVAGVEADYHKQEVFKSLVGLGQRVGALVLAEGAETEEEVSACVDLGADLVQGFYFGRPASVENLSLEAVGDRLAFSSASQKKRAVERLRLRRAEMENHYSLLSALVLELTASSQPVFDGVLERLASAAPEIECVYILDARGIQVTPTALSPSMRRNPPSRLFQPAQKGTDHSSKEYFFALLDGELSRYTTDAYLSLASGKRCRTLSCRFADPDGTLFVLCLDVNARVPK